MYTFGGAIGGAGNLTQSGPGTLVLTGANTYGGTTTVSAGTLQVGTGGTLGATTAALSVSGGTLDLGNSTQTVGGVTINGTIQNGTLYGSSYTGQSGSVTAVLAGTGGLTKNSGTTLVLANSNTYTGATSVSFGTLTLSGSNLTSGVSISGGQLNINNVAALGSGTFTISGGTIDNTSGGRPHAEHQQPRRPQHDPDFRGLGRRQRQLEPRHGAVTLGAAPARSRLPPPTPTSPSAARSALGGHC